MDDAADAMKVEWREWGPAAFEEARDADRPVLLSISARWCGWCQTMDATAYADPRIAAIVNHDFVPIRADADRRPRVRDRYNVGGFPSTVVLTPSGELIAGASFLETEPLRNLLQGVADDWGSEDTPIGRVPHTLQDQEPPVGRLDGDTERFINGQVDVQFEDENAGWGSEEKFPLPTTIEFAMKRQPEKAIATLDALRDGLFDEFDGGFFRHAESDWSDPMREKLLSVNAPVLRAFANGYLVTGDVSYRETAFRTRDYLVDTLWTGEGFGTSQEPGEYFDRPADERSSAAPPPIDESVYARPNALAADALTWLTAYTDDDTAEEHARRTFSILDRDFLEGGVLSHARDGPQAPILGDQATALQAYTSASQVLDREHESLSRRIADATIEHLQTASGAFRDGPAEGPGLLDRPLYPIDENARLARSLVDFSYLADEAGYREIAREALEAFAGAADQMGAQVAGYGTAAAKLQREPLVIDVGASPGSDLHRAALRMADHEKIVVPESHHVDDGHAALRRNGEAVGHATDPESLAGLVADHSADSV
ncbi:MAG: DUF255 domain-containing protein [Halanaeroarchaeum sp.]